MATRKAKSRPRTVTISPVATSRVLTGFAGFDGALESIQLVLMQHGTMLKSLSDLVVSHADALDRLSNHIGVQIDVIGRTENIARAGAMCESVRNLESTVVQLYELREKQNVQMDTVIRAMRNVLRPMRSHSIAGEVIAAASAVLSETAHGLAVGRNNASVLRLQRAVEAVPVLREVADGH